MFLILMIVGLIGMVMMAVPGLNRHGHSGAVGHGAAHGVHLPHVGGSIKVGHAHTTANASGAHAHGTGQTGGGVKEPFNAMRFIPSPRAIFSVLTLFGAFGYALTMSAGLTPLLAGLIATVPALLIERYAVTPAWNALMQFGGAPCSPLEDLLLRQAEAVTPFRNGKGMVQVERDGRAVQFSATLEAAHATMPVRVGDKLTIEAVDAKAERLTVSLH